MTLTANLLPLSIIKKIGAKDPLDSAEFHYLEDGRVCIYLLNEQQRILVARRQGDVFRTWRSVDRAIDFIKSHFTTTTIIQIHFYAPIGVNEF